MRHDQAIALLSGQADALRALGATSLYLFGSTAGGAARLDSDLDLFIDYDPGSRF
jgi:predicted nucleotidyltransferase